MRIPRTLAVFITATVATATIAVASPGTAFANDSTTTTSEVTAALDKADAKNGALVATATPSTTDGGQTITIGLPNASQGGKGAKNGKGVVAYSGRDGSANAVVLADNSGVQFLTTIESKKAPTKYDYPVTLPQGGKIEVAQQNGGGAVVYDAEGKLTALIPAPWAKDANGKWLFEGRTMTAFSDEEEAELGTADNAPWLLADTLRKKGARYEKGPNWGPFVVRDRNLISGQNPASTAPLAKAVLETVA